MDDEQENNESQPVETEVETSTGNEPTEPITETVNDEVSDEDAVAVRDAKIALLTEENAGLSAEIVRLKGQNYDLLMLTGNDPAPEESNDTREETSGGVDSMFAVKED